MGGEGGCVGVCSIPREKRTETDGGSWWPLTVPRGDYLVFIVDFQRYSQEVTTKGTYIIKPIFFFPVS